ncbi:universal stress protein [Nesterenkonia pannonica]|uniref:universal stress protein n=1 Tax=Nesterenkonia pannonica TaxID=1548602 RepID=UPI00216468C3|nr:universal stress protein [Nesterenkonia pannonica]
MLKELSRSAELMVVGARGHGGFLGRMLGSVSSALLTTPTVPPSLCPGTSR